MTICEHYINTTKNYRTVKINYRFNNLKLKTFKFRNLSLNIIMLVYRKQWRPCKISFAKFKHAIFHRASTAGLPNGGLRATFGPRSCFVWPARSFCAVDFLMERLT